MTDLYVYDMIAGNSSSSGSGGSSSPSLTVLNELFSTVRNIYPLLQETVESLLTDEQKGYLASQFRQYLPELLLAGASIGIGLYLLLTDDALDIIFKGQVDDDDETDDDNKKKAKSESEIQSYILLALYSILIAAGAGFLAYRLYMIFVNMPTATTREQ